MDIEYHLIRSDRRSIGIEVDREGKVTVRAPYFCEKKRIERFLLEKENWIRQKVKLQKENAMKRQEKREMPEAEKKYYRNLARRSIRCKDRILCPENGCDLWAYFHPGAEDQVGKLQQRGESQLQLEAGADAAGSSGLCCGA